MGCSRSSWFSGNRYGWNRGRSWRMLHRRPCGLAHGGFAGHLCFASTLQLVADLLGDIDRN